MLLNHDFALREKLTVYVIADYEYQAQEIEM
jgi:hypothetical protein